MDNLEYVNIVSEHVYDDATYVQKTVTGIYSPPPSWKVPGFAKYAVDASLFRLESSILTRVKRATNRNNVATEKRGEGAIFRGGVYLEQKYMSREYKYNRILFGQNFPNAASQCASAAPKIELKTDKYNYTMMHRILYILCSNTFNAFIY